MMTISVMMLMTTTNDFDDYFTTGGVLDIGRLSHSDAGVNDKHVYIVPEPETHPDMRRPSPPTP